MQNTPKKRKTPVWIIVIYIVGIAIAVGCYVFTDATGYLIPGASPLALAAVVGAFTYEHYQTNKENRDGSLIPQLIILGILAAYNLVIGIIGIVAGANVGCFG